MTPTPSEVSASRAISEAKYFQLKRVGKGPREIELDSRIIISEQAARDWDAERERETAAKRQAEAAAKEAAATAAA